MYLKQLTISNYKSFYEPKVFGFEAGFNVLLGANSSGKTSVLQAIEFHDVANIPHRSVLNASDIDTPLSDTPTIELRFSSSVEKVSQLVLPIQEFYIGIGDATGQYQTQNIEILRHKLQLEATTGQFLRLSFNDWPSTWRPTNQNIQMAFLKVRSTNSEGTNVANHQIGVDDIGQLLQKLRPKIYKFSAERIVQSISSHHPNGDLLPNGSNLAYCINHLQSNNKDLFDELNGLLKRVFPSIHWVGAPPNGNNQFELKVHTNPSSIKRGDLAVPINQVGTGVGNALAMLYVALTAQTQRFILLEEPNSFLHPRALRELLAILAEIGSKHQFFVTTHSSDVLRTIKASTVTLLEHDGCQTTVKL
jgi:predicted ATP-dependent endonuclease of OLD family